MAKNGVYSEGDQFSVVPTAPSAPAGGYSGVPILVGQLPGVALTNADANGNVTIDCDGVYKCSVKAVDGGGNSAVAAGDILYLVSADTPTLSKKNTGVRWGYALDPITAGQTSTIRVKPGY